ncbi:MAG: TetR/AcrR family transcriptional regulator C-terminal domain-containing protein [Terracidiphilus sp.]|jgi:AcrR family transcriptional regulator
MPAKSKAPALHAAERAPLDRKIILGHAFFILNSMGVEGLTLRRLAAHLGVQAPALYWHFKSKQELLDEMATHIFREALQEAPVYDADQTWQQWSISYCVGLRKTLLRYREGAKMFSGTYLTNASLYAHMDASLRKLTGAGFTLRQSVVSVSVLYGYVVGFVIEEQAVQPAPGEPDPKYNLASRDARIDKEKYPLAHAAGAVMFADQDTSFLEGVDLIVNGMKDLLLQPPARD